MAVIVVENMLRCFLLFPVFRVFVITVWKKPSFHQVSAADRFVTSFLAHSKQGSIMGKYFLVISEIHGYIK